MDHPHYSPTQPVFDGAEFEPASPDVGERLIIIISNINEEIIEHSAPALQLSPELQKTSC